MSRLIKLIMFYAPVGLGAYFAYLIGVFGPELIGTYARVVGLYYPVAIVYFIFGFSLYTFIAAGRKGVKLFWLNIPPAALTALGTGSSLAALPANLEAAGRIGVPEDVREIVLPIGATIHMDGTCLAAVLKIAVLFSIFKRDFTGLDTLAGVVGVSLLCGVVMSGIPYTVFPVWKTTSFFCEFFTGLVCMLLNEGSQSLSELLSFFGIISYPQ